MMFGRLRTLAFLAIAAPMPVLIHLGLRDEVGAITPAGAAVAFGLALLAGFVLFNFIRGLMRLPILLIAIGLGVVLLGPKPEQNGYSGPLVDQSAPSSTISEEASGNPVQN